MMMMVSLSIISVPTSPHLVPMVEDTVVNQSEPKEESMLLILIHFFFSSDLVKCFIVLSRLCFLGKHNSLLFQPQVHQLATTQILESQRSECA